MSNLPKLPPMAMPGDGTPEGEYLERLKRKLTGTPDSTISQEEYFAMLSQSSLPLPIFEKAKGSNALERREKLVYRTPGKAGADLDRSPLAIALDRYSQRYHADESKTDRRVQFQRNTQKR